MPVPDPFQVAWLGGWILLIITSVLALKMGGPAERIGMLLMIAVAVIGGVIEATLSGSVRGVAHLVNDAVLAIGFLAVALRYGNLWLGGAMLLQAVQFSLHAYYYVVNLPRGVLYAIVNNADSIGI